MSRKPVGGGFLKKIEIVKTGGRTEIVAAANRLMASRAKHLIMQVQTKDMVMARTVMQKMGIAGTVKNLTGTKSSTVKAA